ncbi:MAG: hypothetical protein H7138_11055, partial [Myxococcales bacterium]|nr:hypothetical protein [Myxococcales bacterium]
RSGLADGFRFWATYIKLRQQQTNGFYGVENGLDLRTAQPFYLYSDELADTRLRAAVGKDLWGKLADALLSDLVEDASLPARAVWDAANQNSVVQGASVPPQQLFCTFPDPVKGNVFASPGVFQGCNTYMMIQKLRSAATMPADGRGLDALITWSKGMWPSSDPVKGSARWEALR